MPTSNNWVDFGCCSPEQLGRVGAGSWTLVRTALSSHGHIIGARSARGQIEENSPRTPFRCQTHAD